MTGEGKHMAIIRKDAPKGWSSSDWVWEANGQPATAPTVFDLEAGSVESKILGPDGKPIMKAYRAMDQVGFVRFGKRNEA